MSTFVPSPYQQAVFDFIKNGQGSALVEAVAGSGKTTTLVEATAYLPRGIKAIFLAYNKDIAKALGAELRARRSPMTAQTIHSLGRGVLVKALKPGLEIRLDEGTAKYREIATGWLATQFSQHKYYELAQRVQAKELVSLMVSLCKFARNTLTDPTPEALLEMIAHYGLDTDDIELEALDLVLEGIAPVLAEGNARFDLDGYIDYDDMVWMPLVRNLPCEQYQFVFIDECQDLSNARRELVMRHCRRGRMIFVGDRHQSLYGFTGADTNSVPNIIAAIHATVLPLSICYRCKGGIVRQAQQVVSHIEAKPGVEDGQVEIIKADDFNKRVKVGDMVLCRTTAPLVAKCLELLRNGIPAVVRGKDIGKKFVELLEKLGQRVGFSIDTVGKLVEQHREEQLRILGRIPDNELKIAEFNDRIETFKSLYVAYLRQAMEAHQEPSIYGLSQYFENFFKDKDDPRYVVTLSTVHRAKGKEGPRVFVIEPGLLPHPAARRDWQIEQEYNILYVAITRAKEHLIWVGTTPSSIRVETPEDQPQGIVLVGGAIQAIVNFPMPEPAPVAALPAPAPAGLESDAQRLVREAAAKLNHPAPAHGEALAELLPPGKTLLEAMDDPEVQQQYQDNPVFAEILDAAFALEMQQTQEAFVQRGVVLSSDEELGKALGWPSPHKTPAPQGPQIIRVKVWGKWRDAEVLKVEKEAVSVRILGQHVSAGMSAFWTLGREAVKSEHQALLWPTTTPAAPKVEKSPILAALGQAAIKAERQAQAYLEPTDTCPDCGAACDLSGFACWSCGVVFSKREPSAPVVVVEADPPAPVAAPELCAKCHEHPRGPSQPEATTVHRFPEQQDQLCAECNQELFEQAWALSYSVPGTSWSTPRIFPAAWAAFMDLDVPAATDALCVKCRMQAQMAEGGLIPEQRLLCAGCRIQFYRHAQAMVSQAENVYAFQNSPAQLQAAWPSFIGEPEPPPVEAPVALPAPAPGMCVSCRQRGALNIVANHPELAVLCGECRADVLTKADQQAQATGWGHYEATVREVLARFLSDRPAPAEAVADADAPEHQPREKKPKKEGKDYHTALDGSKARCQITMPTEDLETLKAMGLNPAEVFHELLHRWPPFLEALAAQQKASA